MAEPNPVDRVIKAAEGLEGDGSGRQKLIRRWDIQNQALDGFRRKQYLPLDRAKDAAAFSGIPLRELVRSDIRKAMDQGVAEALLSE